MSLKSNNTGELKKTFRFSGHDQAAMDALRKEYSLKTESAAIEYILHKFIKLDKERRMLAIEIFELKAQNGAKAALINRFTSVLQELQDFSASLNPEPKQSRPRFHRIDEDE